MAQRLILIVTVHGISPLGRRLSTKLAQLRRDVDSSADTAARLATRKSRGRFARMRPNNAPARKGRLQKGMSSGLRWAANGSRVSFDVKEADRRFTYWIIQEIGTGNSATVQGMQTNPQGRPKKNAAYVKIVPKQAGRPISFALAWGTGPGGKWVKSGAGSNQQLHLASKLTGRPAWNSANPRARVRIGPAGEIKGQGMIRFGGERGFDVYASRLEIVGNAAFRGHPKV